MKMKNKTVLVTGGAGAIGGNLVKEFIGKCERIIIVDDLSSGHLENIPKTDKIEFIKSTITDDETLKKCFSQDIDVVFHLAANFANQNSVEHPRRDLLVNGMGTLKILQYAQEYSVDKFIYTSSSCVYGNKTGLLKEDCKEYNLDTPYAITKILGERYVTFFHEYYGMNTVILRYFNCYGPGEYPGVYRNVVPNFIWAAINGKPLTITGTGEETRDFNYVGNAVRGTLLAVENDEVVGETFNIGAGQETKIIDLAKKINEITGNKGGIVFNDRRKWDSIAGRHASVKKAKEILGYEPQINLEEGLKLTYEWIKKNVK